MKYRHRSDSGERRTVGGARRKNIASADVFPARSRAGFSCSPAPQFNAWNRLGGDMKVFGVCKMRVFEKQARNIFYSVFLKVVILD